MPPAIAQTMSTAKTTIHRPRRASRNSVRAAKRTPTYSAAGFALTHCATWWHGND